MHSRFTGERLQKTWMAGTSQDKATQGELLHMRQYEDGEGLIAQATDLFALMENKPRQSDTLPTAQCMWRGSGRLSNLARDGHDISCSSVKIR